MIDCRPSFTDAASHPSLSLTLSRLMVYAFAQAVTEGAKTRAGTIKRPKCGRAWCAGASRTTTKSTIATGFRRRDDLALFAALFFVGVCASRDSNAGPSAPEADQRLALLRTAPYDVNRPSPRSRRWRIHFSSCELH